MKDDAPGIGLTIEIERIKELLPHRYPFLMIDRMVDVVPGERAVGIKNVTVNEPHFEGHFPERPIMPGVLIIEAMAQTAGAFVMESLGKDSEGKLVFFMSVESAKFRRPVAPGDQLRLPVETIQHRKNVWRFRGVATVDRQVVAEASFSAMIMDG